MPVYPGLAISGSVFIGKVKIYKQKELQIPIKSITRTQIESERLKLKTGIDQLESDINVYLQDSNISQLDKDILSTHLMVVTDPEIAQILELAISRDLMSAPQAVFASFEKIIHHFENMENDYYAQRAEDYKDVSRSLLKLLLGDEEDAVSDFRANDVVFIHDITPSMVSQFASKGVKAYCTEHGSYTSHSSILSRAFGFTAIVTKTEIINNLSDGAEVIIDAENNAVIVNPDAAKLEEYNQKLLMIKEKHSFLQAMLDVPSVTRNDINITIKANIGYPEELINVLAYKCDGIGLFRTEFLYLNRQDLPDEDYQTHVYTDILTKLNGLPVTFRTFDLGGDKLTYLQQYNREENPYLGCRGVRFSLQQISMFKAQIRAILKASVHGKANIMFPMIIGVEDFLQAKAIVQECSEELYKAGIEFDQKVPLGVMIETPSAALCAPQLAKVCDFFSLGTNDLVQYTLATDRNNDNVKQFYIQHHPAVLMLIKQTLESANQAGIPVSICGEMASDLMYVPLLIGMGITELSVNPLQTLQVKAVIRNCDDALFSLIEGFDFNTKLADIEYLLKEILKPYYTIQS